MTATSTGAPLRIGVLGAASITPMALLRPARALGKDVVVISAVAARDVHRARRFAASHGIATVCDDYAALLARDDVDAIYNPLPNSHHAWWTIKALEAGKHVLCEKPLAANADDARAMLTSATRHGRILMEAFHWRHHPLADAAIEAIAGLGRRRRVRATFIVPFFIPGDIRYRPELAGGALMDTGCYAVHIARTYAGLVGKSVGGVNDDHIVVDHADARFTRRTGGVDRWFRARFHCASEPQCSIEVEAGLCSAKIFACRARVDADDGFVDVWNPVAPQFGHRLRINTPRRQWSGRIAGEASYTHQLRAFLSSCATGQAPITDGHDGIATMALIDTLSDAAGLAPRRSWAG